jgi:hypothetical protein
MSDVADLLDEGADAIELLLAALIDIEIESRDGAINIVFWFGEQSLEVRFREDFTTDGITLAFLRGWQTQVEGLRRVFGGDPIENFVVTRRRSGGRIFRTEASAQRFIAAQTDADSWRIHRLGEELC